MSESKPLGRLVYYACGGAGINRGAVLAAKVQEPGFDAMKYASIDVYFIDTSDANLIPGIPPSNVYRVPGRDGSGGVRLTNHKVIAECMPDVLLQFPPGDINIVDSSMAGGSGSVIAPILVSELLAQKLNVIVVGVSSIDTRQHLENSIKTQKSYEAIVNTRKRGLTGVILENQPGESFDVVDEQINACTMGLAGLFSRQHKALDTEDLNNWLDFPKTTNFPPKFAALGMYDGTTVGQKAAIISVATLAPEGSDTYIGEVVGYQTVGYVTMGPGINITEPKHFVILDGVIQSAFRAMEDSLATLDEQVRASRRDSGSLLSAEDRPDASGLVF